MGYEKEYKRKALERAKAGKPMDEVFPELKESEDERIIMELKDFVRLNCGPGQDEYKRVEEWCYWLEKRKEQKSADVAPNQFDGITYGMSGYSTEQPAEWSEEDERNYKFVEGALIGCYSYNFRKNLVNWLKSLRLQPKQEWSEEDKNIINGAVGALEAHGHEKLAKRLKSIRPQPHWRPSVAQMRALDEVYKTHSADNVCRRIIFNLMEDLKKLL